MGPVLIVFATREGHTHAIAERAARRLEAGGLAAEIHEARPGDPRIDLSPYAGVIVASPVHYGRHAREIVMFVRRHREQLERSHAAFLSVSLSQASVERATTPPQVRAEARRDVGRLLQGFSEQTGWHPARVQPVAGALAYSRYNVILRWVMKAIARRARGDTDTSRDHVYTDWQALDRFVDELAGEIAGERPAVRGVEPAADSRRR